MSSSMLGGGGGWRRRVEHEVGAGLDQNEHTVM